MLRPMTVLISAMLSSWIIIGSGFVVAAEQHESSQIASAAPSEPSDHQAGKVVKGSALKLIRGIANITLGWMDFPKQAYLIGRKDGLLIGLTRGPIDGFGMLRQFRQ